MTRFWDSSDSVVSVSTDAALPPRDESILYEPYEPPPSRRDVIRDALGEIFDCSDADCVSCNARANFIDRRLDEEWGDEL